MKNLPTMEDQERKRPRKVDTKAFGTETKRPVRYGEQINVRISPELAARLDDASRRTRQTKTTLIVTALNLLLDMPKDRANQEIARYVMHDS